MKDKIEKAFHEALMNYEVPYDPQAWKSLQKQLPTAKTKWLLGSIAAAFFTSLVLIAIFQKQELRKNQVKTYAKLQKVTAIQQTTLEVVNSKKAPNVSQAKSSITISLDANKSNRILEFKSAVLDVRTEQVFNNNEINQTSNPNSQQKAVLGQISPLIETNSNAAIKDLDRIQIIGLQQSYCENSPVALRANNIPQTATVSWSLSNGKVIQGEMAKFLAQKNMEVTLLVSSKENQSELKTITRKIAISEPAKPIVDVIFKEHNTKKFVTLTNTNPNIEHIIWRFENNTFKGQSCGAYLTSKGLHEYTIDSYDRNGCFYTSEGQIQSDEDYNLYVQNTFTPNGDGINDVFIPEALKSRSVNFKLSIFDKNGKPIYTTTDIHMPWNGTIQGQPVLDDIYIWTVTLINEEGLPEQYKGQISVYRP
jgi:gliding motility-associated-like protein